MKAISLWQPFASAIPYGFKRNETRHWSTNYRGLLAIHAAKKDTPELRAIGRQGGLPDNLPFGQVVAICQIINVIPSEIMTYCVDPLERHFGDYDPGRFAWLLTDIRPITPFPFKGGQGFFNIPDELFR